MSTESVNQIHSHSQSDIGAEPTEEELLELIRIQKLELENRNLHLPNSSAQRLQKLREELSNLEQLNFKSNETAILAKMQQELTAAREKIASYEVLLQPNNKGENDPRV